MKQFVRITTRVLLYLVAILFVLSLYGNVRIAKHKEAIHDLGLLVVISYLLNEARKKDG